MHIERCPRSPCRRLIRRRGTPRCAATGRWMCWTRTTAAPAGSLQSPVRDPLQSAPFWPCSLPCRMSGMQSQVLLRALHRACRLCTARTGPAASPIMSYFRACTWNARYQRADGLASGWIACEAPSRLVSWIICCMHCTINVTCPGDTLVLARLRDSTAGQVKIVMRMRSPVAALLQQRGRWSA